MIELDELLPEVMKHCPSAPEPLAIGYLRQAAMQLCEEAMSWRVTEMMDVTTPECEAILTTQEAQIIRIEQAFLDERPLEPVTVANMDLIQPGWEFRYTDNSGSARYAVQKEWNTISIVPRQPGELVARLILKPSRSALAIPQALVERYSEALGSAAAAKCLLTNNPEISNPQLGAALWAAWTDMLTDLSIKEQQSQLRTKARTHPQYF